jgi:PKD repeat protein
VDESNNAVGLYRVTVVPSFTPPIPCFTAQPTNGAAPLDVAFDASCASDPDGSIVDYRWDFGDGGLGFGRSVNHTYFSPGFYTATLTVFDNQGYSDSQSTNVFVSDPSCPSCPE